VKKTSTFCFGQNCKFYINYIIMGTYEGSENLVKKLLIYDKGLVRKVDLTTKPQPFGGGP